MNSQDKLRDKWLWNKEILSIGISVPIILSILLAIFLYPVLSDSSLFAFSFSIIGILIGIIYGYVGKRVNSLKVRYSNTGGKLSESLVVIGRIQSPGIVIFKENEIMLIPIAGKTRTIKLNEIRFLRCVNYFNGKTLIWKKWIVLSVSPRLGFAVPKTVAKRWMDKITDYLSSNSNNKK